MPSPICSTHTHSALLLWATVDCVSRNAVVVRGVDTRCQSVGPCMVGPCMVGPCMVGPCMASLPGCAEVVCSARCPLSPYTPSCGAAHVLPHRKGCRCTLPLIVPFTENDAAEEKHHSTARDQCLQRIWLVSQRGSAMYNGWGLGDDHGG
jgi:hypothetical protein